MAFIRIKKIKGKPYGYVVSNTYRKRGNRVRQKTLAYLGKAIIPEKKFHTPFLAWINPPDPLTYASSTVPEEIINDLVRWEKWKHGMSQEEIPVLKINHGHLCSYAITHILTTFRNIQKESSEGAYERDYALALADAFVKAGIEVPESVFIALYQKATEK